MTTEQMISELGIESSDDTIKAQIISNILGAADLRFARVVDEVMTDEERREFEEFSVGKGPQDVAGWIGQKYEGIGDMYTAIVESIVKDLKNKNQQG